MTVNPDRLYLNTLPAHPDPMPLETLSSYLKRLAQANGIHHLATFSHLTGISQPDRLLELHPPPDWGCMAQTTQTSPQQLLTLTTYYLVHKFGRVTSPGRFLARSCSPYLRWCTHCLAEEGYYQLPWQFLLLRACPHHAQPLLDHCPHCQRKISLKSPTMQLTACPYCTGDLSQAQVVNLSPEERMTCHQDWEELVYLLSPQDWQLADTTDIADAMRQRLGYLRRLQNRKAPQVARALGVSQRILGALENETQSGTGETFADYLRYADYFGLTLQAVFCESAQVGYIHKDVLYADNLLQEARKVVAQLKRQGIPVTQKQIAQSLGHTASMLRKYPKIHALLRSEAAIRDKLTDTYEDQLYEQVQPVIQTLQEQQKRLSKRKIALQLGYNSAKIRKHYPRVEQLLVSAVNQYQQQTQHSSQLRQDVQQALQVFRQQGLSITQKNIAQYLDVSVTKLGDDPYIQSLIAEQQQEAHDCWLKALKERIAREMNLLLEQEMFVSQTTLLIRLQLTKHCFAHYPELNAIWQAFDAEQRQQREARMLERVQEAIQACQQEDIPLTFRVVEKIVVVTRLSMKGYPSVYALLKAHNLVRT